MAFAGFAGSDKDEHDVGLGRRKTTEILVGRYLKLGKRSVGWSPCR